MQRPRTVPAGARWIEQDREWELGPVDADGERHGDHLYWRADGTLCRTCTFVHGTAQDVPDEDDDRDEDDGEGDASGEDWPEVLADERRPAAEWRALAAAYLEDDELGLALCATARAAAETGSAQELTALAGRRAGRRELAEEGGPLEIAEALAEGADLGAALRALAIALENAAPARSRAASDLLAAAMRVEPSRWEYLFDRALIRVSLGDHAGASADVEALGRHSAEHGAFLALYLRVLFARFDFWPSRVKPETYHDGLPDGPAQPVEAIRATAQKYATRLMQLRERLLAFGPASAPWMPPDLSALLPDGPVALAVGELEIPDPQDLANPYVVEVDEALPCTGALALPELLRHARAGWAALTWLCWACGLSRVGLPGAVKAPADFGAAAGMSQQRLWRCRDRRITGGAGAQAQGTPGFAWEGVEIDELPDPLLDLPETEYAEMQAMFRWLCDAAVESPWQDNLRES